VKKVPVIGVYCKFVVIFSLIDFISVVDADLDLDPKGSEPFCRIRIQIIVSDPEPKVSEYKFYVVELEFLCFENIILSVSS